MKIIDLSVPFIESQDITTTLRSKLPIYCGHECYAYDLQIKSHAGTYFETSAHLFRDGKNTSDIPITDLVLPGYCVQVHNNDSCITADHFEKHLGSIAPNAAVLVDVANDRDKYFSRDAAQWLAAHKVKLMGSNTQRYDTGFVTPTGFFIDLFKAEIPIIAGLTNLDRLPKNNFQVIALPLQIENICTVPCRIIATLETGLISAKS